MTATAEILGALAQSYGSASSKACFGIAYRITNLVSGKQYIGITKGDDPLPRWARHQHDSSECRALRGAIKKYSARNFSVETVASSWSETNLFELERLLVRQDNTKVPFGYNMNDGGSGGLNPGPETRALISASLIGNSRTKGRPLSSEHKAKLSRAFSGRVMPLEAVAKVAAALRGRRHTLEARQKQSLAKRGKGIIAWNRGGSIAGERFGRLLVIEELPYDRRPRKADRFWLCLCDCGKSKIVEGYQLRAGKTKSCGCLMAEISRERALKRWKIIKDTGSGSKF